jgi:hypothetical protein
VGNRSFKSQDLSGDSIQFIGKTGGDENGLPFQAAQKFSFYFFRPAPVFLPIFSASSSIFCVESDFSLMALTFPDSLVEKSETFDAGGVDFDGDAIVDFMAERGFSTAAFAASCFAGPAYRLMGKAKNEIARVLMMAFFILILLSVLGEKFLVKGLRS